MRAWALLSAVLAWLTFAPAALAADKEYALNKEGFWVVGRGDATSDVCSATLPVKGGGAFFLLANNKGEVTFSADGKSKAPRGKAGVLATDKTRFDFAPSFDKTAVFLDGSLDEKVLAALREAQDLIVMVEDKTVFSAQVAGTGIAGAVDGVLACARGEAGWWGKGALAAGGGATRASAKAAAPAFSPNGLWVLAANDQKISCVAAAKAAEGLSFALITDGSGFAVALTSKSVDLKGRRARFETDAFGFDFTPAYEEANTYVYSPGLRAEEIGGLLRAKSGKFIIDGRVLADLDFTDAGLPEIMSDLRACARGQSGWWGKGSPQTPPAR